MSVGFNSIGDHIKIHSTVVFVNCNRISIGSNVRIDPFVVISAGEHVRIGNNVHISSHCSLVGRAEIDLADFSGLSAGVKIFTTSDDYSGISLTNPTVPDEFKIIESAPVKLGRHVIVGAGSVILPGADLGEGVAIGALSLVDRPLEAWSIYAGTPVRRIKARSQEMLAKEKLYLSV